jgi:hypothetical protein
MKISISKARAWRDGCPRAFWYRHVARAVPVNPIDPHRLAGTVMHAGLAGAFAAAARATAQERTDMWSEFAEDAVAAMEEAGGTLADADMHDCLGKVADLLAGIPVPHPDAVLGVEHRFSFTTAADIQVEGVLDLVLRTGERSLHVRDWKTSTPKHDPGTDEQLLLGAAAAHRLWPWAKEITVGLYGITKRTEVTAAVTAEQTRGVLEDLERDALDIDVAASSTPGLEPGEIFTPELGEECAGCPFRSYCPAYHGHAPLLPGFHDKDVAATRDSLEAWLATAPIHS